jgi:HlyD family secretion protein
MISISRPWGPTASPWLTAALAVLVGCAPGPAGPEPLQGILEFEEHVLGFEIPGRVRSIAVKQGDRVEPGAELAQLDDTLERLAREARVAEARAVTAELGLLQAGVRPEEITSLKAALTSAKASETLAKQNATRQRQLSGSGIGTPADLDAAETGVSTTAANRRDLEARLLRARHGARTEEIDAAAARAEAASAAVRLSDERIARHVLRTHVPGTVLDVHVETDEFTPVGTAVVTLGDVHRPYVDVFVPQARVGEIQLGDAMTVQTDGSGPLVGTVEHISRQTEFTPKFLFSAAERPNLVIRVRVRIEVPTGDLPAGVPTFVTPGSPT